MSYLKIDHAVKLFAGPGGGQNVVLNDIRAREAVLRFLYERHRLVEAAE